MTAPTMTVFVAVIVAIAQPPVADPTPAEYPVDLIVTGSMRLIFIEHDGPNWAATRKFAAVREYMSLHNQPGPLLVLYQRSTRRVTSPWATSLIGFVAKDAHVPDAPFQTRMIPARQVLRLDLEGKTASPRRLLNTIEAWAADNGHATSGEVLEIYHLSPGANGRIERTEFQLPLASAPIDPTHPRRNLDKQTPDHGSGPTGQALPTAIDTAVAQPSDSVGVKPEARSPKGSAIDSIPVLIRAAQFDRAAALLLPDGHDIDHDEQIWLGHVIFRIKAAGKGLEQKFPKTDGATTALAEALLARYRVLFKAPAADVLVFPVATPEEPVRSRGAERRAIMRQLDALLSRITLGTAEPDKVAGEIADLLERLHLVLQK